MAIESTVTPPLALPEAEAARLLGISSKSLKRLAMSGEPVGRAQLGGRVVYSVEALQKYLAGQIAAAK